MGLLKIVILNEVKYLYLRFTDIRDVLTALNMTFLEHLIIEALSLCADNYPTTLTVLLELLPSWCTWIWTGMRSRSSSTWLMMPT